MRVKKERGEGSWFRSFRIQKSIQHPFVAPFNPYTLELSLHWFFSGSHLSNLSLFKRRVIRLPGGGLYPSDGPFCLGEAKNTFSGNRDLGGHGSSTKHRRLLSLPMPHAGNGGWNCLLVRKCCVFSKKVPNLHLSAEVNQADVHCQHTHAVN